MNNNIIQTGQPLYINQNQVFATYGSEPTGTHYVMWSGGCDSTLLLYELLDTYGCDNVVCISYKYPWLFDIKYQSEKLHRESFKSKMKLRGEKFANIRHIEITISEEICSGSRILVYSSGLPQAVAWMLSIPLYANNDSYIYTGAIRSDDLTLVLDGYYQMFEGIAKTLHKNIYLREPYLYLNKSDIIDKLFQYEIYDASWFCEIPNNVGSECFKCNPCKTHISALTELSLGATSELISLQAKNKLKQIEETKKYRIDNPDVDNEEIKSDKIL